MASFPSQNLYSQKICESYNKLLQIYSGSLLLDGTGSQIQLLNVTSSYAQYALNCTSDCTYDGSATTQSFNNLSTWTFNHNLNQKYVTIQTYDVNDDQILPSKIHLQSENTAIITFPYALSGTAIASVGANITGSIQLLQTGSTYPITASWSLNTLTASYIQVTGVSYPVRKVVNNYTIVNASDYTILCDATSGSFDVKLPNPSGNTNIYNIKKIDRTGYCINVTVTNASFIDYDITQSICHRGTNMTVQSDGINQYWVL
jgi:hypothetical protein